MLRCGLGFRHVVFLHGVYYDLCVSRFGLLFLSLSRFPETYTVWLGSHSICAARFMDLELEDCLGRHPCGSEERKAQGKKTFLFFLVSLSLLL